MTQNINRIFIIAGTLIMMFVMMSTGKTLKTKATPLGIINLELAWNSSRADHVISAWSVPAPGNIDNIKVAIQNTWLDFIFLFFYSLFLFYLCLSISESSKGIIKVTGKLMAMAALNAGMLDIFENAGMLFTLNNFSSNGIALFTAVCSALKWFLVLCSVLYILLAGPWVLLRKDK